MATALSLFTAMRAIDAIFFFAATTWPCASADRDKSTILSDSLVCAKTLGFEKCITAFGIWKAERALKHENQKESFKWLKYVNQTDEELYARLCQDTEELLRIRPLTMSLGERYVVKMMSTGNNSLNFDIIENKDVNTARTSMKKMMELFYKVLPILILPGLVLSASFPFFLPTLKMATMATMMLNKMALTGAIFTLLRNNAFNDHHYPKRVIYINAGYGKHKYDPIIVAPSENVDDVAGPNFETQHSTEVTHDVKDYHLVGIDPNTGISSPFNFEWLKNTDNTGKVKNVQIIGEVPDWRKPNANWPPII
ncbi:unnamed protein product [Leptosia nina]|uniref:Uncharacterized protein n=1 Tax=Leptosia nina TaxID=320188 RepID=A0AAV1IVM7_9NEOP